MQILDFLALCAGFIYIFRNKGEYTNVLPLLIIRTAYASDKTAAGVNVNPGRRVSGLILTGRAAGGPYTNPRRRNPNQLPPSR